MYTHFMDGLQPDPGSDDLPPVSVLSTGSLRLDIALNSGGLPRGCFIEIGGPPASGKTTLCQHIIAEAQKCQQTCAYVDADHTLDLVYAKRCGLNPNKLLVVDPQHAEHALESVDMLARSGGVTIIIIDSVTSLVPFTELQQPIGKAALDNLDSLLSISLRRLAPVIQRSGATVIFTSRTGAYAGPIYHGLSQKPQRLALNLHSTVRLQLTPISTIAKNGVTEGQRVGVRILKNRNLPCADRIELDIMYNHGVVKAGEILDYAIQLRLLEIHGAVYNFQNQQFSAQQEQAVEFLQKNAHVSNAIELAIRQRLLPSLSDPQNSIES